MPDSTPHADNTDPISDSESQGDDGAHPIATSESQCDDDARPIAATKARKGKGRGDISRRSWSPLEISLLVGAVLLITVSAFEAMATTTIMPNVVADLGAQSWFSVASGAALAAQLTATVIAGGLADSRGPKVVLIGGTAIFLGGVLICATAPHIAVFVAGRLLQGVGGGLVIVPLYVLIGLVGHESHRPTFFAAFSMAWLLPSIIGPALAGWMTTHIGWRWVFGAIPFVALVAFIPLIRVMQRIPQIERQNAPHLVSLGLFGAGAGLGLVTLQLAGAVVGVASWALLGVGLVLVGVALPRLLPGGALTFRPGVPSLVATRAWIIGAFTGATALLPLLLQRVHEWSTESAALLVTVGSVGWSVGSVLQSRIHLPQVRQRLPLYGAIAVAAGLVPFFLLAVHGAPLWPVVVGLVVMSTGIGLAHASLSVRILDLLPQSKHGKGSSWLQVADSAGGALELAAASVILGLWAQIPGQSVGAAHMPAPLLALGVAVIGVVAAARGCGQSSSPSQ